MHPVLTVLRKVSGDPAAPTLDSQGAALFGYALLRYAADPDMPKVVRGIIDVTRYWTEELGAKAVATRVLKLLAEARPHITSLNRGRMINANEDARSAARRMFNHPTGRAPGVFEAAPEGSKTVRSFLPANTRILRG